MYSPWIPSLWSEWSAFSPPNCGREQERARWRQWSRSCRPPLCNGTGCDGNTTYIETDAEKRSAEENCCRKCGFLTLSRHVALLRVWLMRRHVHHAALCDLVPATYTNFFFCISLTAVAGEWTSFETVSVGPWSSWSPKACNVTQTRWRTRIAARWVSKGHTYVAVCKRRLLKLGR